MVFSDEFEERVLKALKVRKNKKETRRERAEEDYETVEEVFDRPTLMTLYNLLNRGYIGRVYGVVAAGKEARIYWGEDCEGQDIAIKIFLVSTAEFWKSRKVYIEGDPRFRYFRKDRRHLIRIWCSKEFKNLKLAYNAGIRVPKPITFQENVLIMEFIGDPNERGRPAPLLKDMPPEDPYRAYRTIIRYIRKTYREAGLVHADLSEYNIMNREPEYVVIDWGSGVKREHPRALVFLRRDINNITWYFKRLGVKVEQPDRVFYKITS